MKKLTFVGGAPDAEMKDIEVAVRKAGHFYVQAVDEHGRPVGPSGAYRASWTHTEVTSEDEVVLVECDFADAPASINVVASCDHHRPGDAGFGRPPEEFEQASSLGQVLRLLGVEPNPRQKLVMAADHCLGAAYAGRCPGINREDLFEYRIEEKAAWTRRTRWATADAINEVVRIIKGKMAFTGKYGHGPGDWLEGADGAEPTPPLLADFRGQPAPDDLAEAGCYLGVPYLAEVPDRDGRQKIVLGGASPELVQRFLDGEVVPGLTERYGDPARGFAGGYLSQEPTRWYACACGHMTGGSGPWCEGCGQNGCGVEM